MTDGGTRRAWPVDYDHDPDRFAVNRAATAAYSSLGDVHGPVARRLAASGSRHVLDLGGGTGTLATELAARGLGAVVVDEASHVVQAPRPAVRADLRSLPFRDDAGDIVASVMTHVEVENWDAPIVELPDPGAVAIFLRGRGLSVDDAARQADASSTPMRVTKRGCLVWARSSTDEVSSARQPDTGVRAPGSGARCAAGRSR